MVAYEQITKYLIGSHIRLLYYCINKEIQGRVTDVIILDDHKIIVVDNTRYYIMPATNFRIIEVNK